MRSTGHPNFKKGRDKADKCGDDYHVSTGIVANIGDPDDLVAEARERGELIPADTELDNPDPRSIQSVADERLAGMSDQGVQEVQDVLLITDEPSELVETFEAFEDAGVTRLLVTFNLGDPEQSIKAFGDWIIPAF